MKRERIVEFVGGSEEEIAYLRLLLRKAAGKLDDKWRLRREDDSHVDLLVIHDLNDPGLVSPAPGGESPPRQVRLIDSVFGAAGMQTALWPLTVEQIVKVLNTTAVEGEQPRPPPALVIEQNVYDDLFESGPSSRWQPSEDFDLHAPLDFNNEWVQPPRHPESALMLEAEMLFRRDPTPDHKETLAAIRLGESVGIEATDGLTARGSSRKDQRDAISLPSGMPHSLSFAEGNQWHSLASYLTGRLLPGPSQIEATHIVLTVDPRNRHYYARGALCIFEDSCKQTLRRGDWRSLTSTEFASVKEQIAPRPYTELLWLCHYLARSSPAESEFAANARFRLLQSLDLQKDYPVAAWIARELEQGATLATAAAAAGVPLAHAQHIVAAFDAVGILIPD